MHPVAKPTRDEAWDLVCEWVSSDSLRKHLLGVEAGMVAYADKLGGDRELWAVSLDGAPVNLKVESGETISVGAAEWTVNVDVPHETVRIRR